MEHERRQTILIADDSEMNRAILIEMLDGQYNILEAADGEEAIAAIQLRNVEIDLMLLDIVMPRMDGLEVLKIMNYQHWIQDIPVIMISAEREPSTVERAYELGVTDFIFRPFDPHIVRRRITNTLLLYAKQRKLADLVTDQIYEKEKRSGMMIDILSHIVEFRNGESGQHVRNIHVLTDIFIHYLNRINNAPVFTADEMNNIVAASALHDIGKIAIPSAVLNKPGTLNEEETKLMRSHTVIGAQMLTELPVHQREPFLKTAYAICRWHHERYDGSGYPDGLRGDAIPMSAQVVALADVYDALTSTRVYKKAYSHEEAVRMILNGQCGAFHPLLMTCLRETADRLPQELKTAAWDSGEQQEIRAMAEEVQQHEELSASSRTLQLLEYERIKARFFADMSGEIQFEYTVTPPKLTLTAFSAQKLGLDEMMLNPLKDERVQSIMQPKDVQGLSDALHATIPEQPVVQYEFKVNIESTVRWGRIIARAIWTDDSPPRYLGAIGKVVDIHEEHARIKALEWLSMHDSLTGLLNHSVAREKIRERMHLRPHSRFVMLIFDMDRFKCVNDSRGHLFGDQTLRLVAERLRASVRSGDIIARVGGDEFLVFLEYKTDDTPIVQRIFDSIACEKDGQWLTASMGAARSEMLGNDYETLFHAADQALYAAKAAGGGKLYYYRDDMKDLLSAVSAIEEPPMEDAREVRTE